MKLVDTSDLKSDSLQKKSIGSSPIMSRKNQNDENLVDMLGLGSSSL